MHTLHIEDCSHGILTADWSRKHKHNRSAAIRTACVYPTTDAKGEVEGKEGKGREEGLERADQGRTGRGGL